MSTGETSRTRHIIDDVLSPILIVDDDADIRAALQHVLESAGYSTIQAADGREALTTARRQPPGLVLLDLMMPVMDGFSFMEACHHEQLCDDVPIVVISAVHDALERISAVPVHACIAKPFDLDDLVRTVGQFASPNGQVT